MYVVCRGIIALSRTFPEILLAIFFVKLFGFGPFAGFVTLSVATIGFYGKLLAEDIEHMDARQAEAVRADMAERGFHDVASREDLAGIERATLGRWTQNT